MQRYLATKHQHLKKASEQLLNNRPNEFRQSLTLANSNLPPYQHPPKVSILKILKTGNLWVNILFSKNLSDIT